MISLQRLSFFGVICVAIMLATPLVVLGAVFISSTISNGAIAGDSTLGHPCTIDTAMIPDDITSVRDLELVMQRYFLHCSSDLTLLEGIFQKETRDPQWASPLEARIKE